MPICTRDGLDKKVKTPEKFHDNERVFYCETTREIFRNYEDYFQRVMLINSTIWSCSLTGRNDLTYSEALKSERKARKKLNTFKEILRGPSLIVVDKLKKTNQKEALQQTYQFLKDRFFLGELVDVARGSSYVECEILEIIKPDKCPDDGVYDPSNLSYKVRRLKGDKTVFVTLRNTMRRHRYDFTLDNLRLFLKENTEIVEGRICAKKAAYKLHVLDPKVSFEKLFIGKLPDWKPSKIPQKKDEKKQATMSKYLVKNNGENEKVLSAAEKAKRAAEAEALAAAREKEIERLKREKEEKQAELERLKLERHMKIEAEIARIMKKCDDLEREDQKMLPVFKPVNTVVASKYFGEFLAVQEFLHSFSPILAAHDVFRTNINFYQMCRAFLVREVAGPLSDILQVLLSTIFSLQTEENDECRVEFLRGKMSTTIEPGISINEASDTQFFCKNQYSAKLWELPIDSQTLSEVLRLHLLGSGAKTDERSERWRFQYRNGYSHTGDPGLYLRLQQPHILRALKMYTVYQLPFSDILKIMKCLIDQILTHYGTLNLIDERNDALAKVRSELRGLIIAENKRASNVSNLKKKTAGEHYLQVKEAGEDEEKKKKLEEELSDTLREIDTQDKSDRKKFEDAVEKAQSVVFDHIVEMGSDRAYRKYYIFESIQGLFIEHPKTSEDEICLTQPPKNCMTLAKCNQNRKEVRILVTNRFKLSDKENTQKSIKDNLIVNKVVLNGDVKVNGIDSVSPAPVPNNLTEPEIEPTQYELYMCTGDPKHCIVHDERNQDRVRWSYINTEEELNTLIESLNMVGNRESELKQQLTTYKHLILGHIKKCPEAFIAVDDRKKFINQMYIETQRKYNNPNFGLPDDADINEVMYSALVTQILQLEDDITSGNLGKLKVKNLIKWRDDLLANKYDSQGEIKYGPHPDDSTDSDKFKDPGSNLGNTIDIGSDDSSDDEISLHDSPTLRQNVKSLASALLQVEQSIAQKFLKEPFGAKNELKDKKEMEHRLTTADGKRKRWEVSLMESTSFSQVFLHMCILNDSIQWSKSINQSRCIVCRKKGDPEKMLLCDECNAGTHMYCLKPALKKIPEGNWYCKRCESKMEKPAVKPARKPKKRIFTMEVEDDEEIVENNKKANDTMSTDDDEWKVGDHKLSTKDLKRKQKERNPKKKKSRGLTVMSDLESLPSDSELEEEEAEDNEEFNDEEQSVAGSSKSSKSSESIKPKENGINYVEEIADPLDTSCKVCGTEGCVLCCGICESQFHLECTGLRRQPRGLWICQYCKEKENKKRKVEKMARESDSSESDDEPLVKRTRPKPERYEEVTPKYNNNSRRSRRTGEFSPLNTIELYSLLDDIAKHEDAWPFLRPVSLHEVPDYHEIIKNPIDFARIKSNLNMGKYTTTEEVMSDIQLVFRNCDTYNVEGNDIYSAGASLERFVAERCKKVNLPFKASDMISNP